MTANYMLEIYQPGSADEVLQSIESDRPFMAMSAGDLMHPFGAADATTSSVLMITRLEHIVQPGLEGGAARHKICVFTRRVDELNEARKGGLPHAT